MTRVRELTHQHCKPCAAGTPALTGDESRALLEQLEGWALHEQKLSKTFQFKNYYQTIAFVNAVAWMTHHEDHHPDLAVGYNTCRVEYSTHAVGGLSENDFICAAKVDALFKP
ncbi:MAG: 4a-hydroxytetrahydrobiopterin dehydratase [Sideroxydans sp.]